MSTEIMCLILIIEPLTALLCSEMRWWLGYENLDIYASWIENGLVASDQLLHSIDLVSHTGQGQVMYSLSRAGLIDQNYKTIILSMKHKYLSFHHLICEHGLRVIGWNIIIKYIILADMPWDHIKWSTKLVCIPLWSWFLLFCPFVFYKKCSVCLNCVDGLYIIRKGSTIYLHIEIKFFL